MLNLCPLGNSGTLKVTQSQLEKHLRNTYTSPWRDEPLPEMERLVRPAEPGCPYDTSDLRWAKTNDHVRKARASSALGTNGISCNL